MLLHFGDLFLFCFLFLDCLCMILKLCLATTILDYPNKYHCTWTLTFCVFVVTL